MNGALLSTVAAFILSWMLIGAMGDLTLTMKNQPWVRDASTGKHYLDLNITTPNHQHGEDICSKMGGILPQPKNAKENEFLKSFASGDFFLGMSDTVTEGAWLWEGDSAPVQWFDWIAWTADDTEPNGGRSQNCAMMFPLGNKRDSKQQGWVDIECTLIELIYSRSTVICETKYISTTDPPSTHLETTPNSSECQNGSFGLECTKTCQCSNKSEVCDKLTGRCVSGCLAGWKGSDCQWRDCSHFAYCGNHTCQELRHDYNCSCLDGYENSDSQHCEDTDECKQDVCDIHTCRNTEGSYDCICRNESYENIHRQLCLPKIDNVPETMEHDFELPEIHLRVVIQTLSAIVSTVLVLIALMCVRTVAISIWRFYTTESYTRNLRFPEITNRLFRHIVMYEMEPETDKNSIDGTVCDAEGLKASRTDVSEESVTDISGEGNIGRSISQIASSSVFSRNVPSSVTFSISKLKNSVSQTDGIEEVS